MMTRRYAAVSLLCACGWHRDGATQVFPNSAPPILSIGDATANGCGVAQLQRRPGSRVPLKTSGIASVDELLLAEAPALNRHFRVKPDFSFHDDNSEREALALRESGRRTRILIGKELVRHEMAESSNDWKIAVTGILAHEWGHALQYSNASFEERVYLWETHADYLSGWYLGSKFAAQGINGRPEAFARSLAAKGSRKGYFDPDTHGLPSQRVHAMFTGFEDGKRNFTRKYGPELIWDAAERGYEYAKLSAR